MTPEKRAFYLIDQPDGVRSRQVLILKHLGKFCVALPTVAAVAAHGCATTFVGKPKRRLLFK